MQIEITYIEAEVITAALRLMNSQCTQKAPGTLDDDAAIIKTILAKLYAD